MQIVYRIEDKMLKGGDMLLVAETDLWSLRNMLEKAYEFNLYDEKIPLKFKQRKLVLEFLEPTRVIFTSMELKTTSRLEKEIGILLKADDICDVLKKIPIPKSKNKDDPERYVSIFIDDDTIKFEHPKISIRTPYEPIYHSKYQELSKKTLKEILKHKIIATVDTRQLQLFLKIIKKVSLLPRVKFIYDGEKLIGMFESEEIGVIECVLAGNSNITIKDEITNYDMSVSLSYFYPIIKRIKCPTLELAFHAVHPCLTVRWVENEWLKGYNVLAGLTEGIEEGIK